MTKLGSLDAERVERHCLALAGELPQRAEVAGLRRVTRGPASHIVVLRTSRADGIAMRLRERGVRATALGDRVRFGFHYFNDEHDAVTAASALA
ncbi:hypothetical protein [Nonomuraea sp. SYSU D8015]|uniref:hypothetical protein n=1 Tax=Nonomuraea sp. SYSU D8015 TaxID=2593644 RepID=UPI0016609E45|nr:hypothetical protein [Nonomuraea sp. SYSU D8015]